MLPALLRDLSAGAGMLIHADGALRVAGALSAPSIIVRAEGPLTLDNLLVQTGGVPFVQAPPGGVSLARLPDPAPGTAGAYFETLATELTILDTLTINPLGGAPNATAALRLPVTGGVIDLAKVEAPNADLVLDLGTGGRAAGEIRLRNLTVYGGGGGTDLQGTIGGQTGQAAASLAGLGPRLQPEYQINDCPLSSVNCVQLVVRLPVPTDPLRDVGQIATREDRDDPDIFVPNVAERDF
jgi:hypothetical protein